MYIMLLKRAVMNT